MLISSLTPKCVFVCKYELYKFLRYCVNLNLLQHLSENNVLSKKIVLPLSCLQHIVSVLLHKFFSTNFWNISCLILNYYHMYIVLKIDRIFLISGIVISMVGQNSSSAECIYVYLQISFNLCIQCCSWIINQYL